MPRYLYPQYLIKPMLGVGDGSDWEIVHEPNPRLRNRGIDIQIGHRVEDPDRIVQTSAKPVDASPALNAALSRYARRMSFR